MPKEIERKFLVAPDFDPSPYPFFEIKQGYLCSDKERSVRIRLRDEEGFLTIKGATNKNGTSRYEFEHKISKKEAEELLELALPGKIIKRRYLIPNGKHTIELDVFGGENEGLILAEIELASENEAFIRPDWLIKEVTGDKRYYNSQLAQQPYIFWDKK